ncbi:hypothetical protein C8F01DRAFT_319670 [Mycena amicta]|nr:hypothetical protein C8F01DRAFT_319670 [Mycena amicta]
MSSSQPVCGTPPSRQLGERSLPSNPPRSTLSAPPALRAFPGIRVVPSRLFSASHRSRYAWSTQRLYRLPGRIRPRTDVPSDLGGDLHPERVATSSRNPIDSPPPGRNFPHPPSLGRGSVPSLQTLTHRAWTRSAGVAPGLALKRAAEASGCVSAATYTYALQSLSAHDDQSISPPLPLVEVMHPPRLYSPSPSRRPPPA